jgi:hypothetical protein
VDLVDPIVSYLGVESGDPVGHKRFLALFSGGMLPIISLSFLHMLVKFEEEEKKKVVDTPQDLDIDELSIRAGKMEAELEKEKYTPTKEELSKLEDELRKLNEQKFGTLEGPSEDLRPDDFVVEEVIEDEQPIEETTDPEVKRLSYIRSHG